MMKRFMYLALSISLSVGIFFTSCRKKKKHDLQHLPTKVAVFTDTSYMHSTLQDSNMLRVRSFGNTYDSLIYRQDLDTIKNYLKTLGKKDIFQTSSGAIYIIEEYGYGNYALKYDRMQVHSLGTTLYGKKIFSTYDYKQPLEFILGVGQVIPAWDEVLPNLPEGTKATIIAPSTLAYSQYSMGKYLPKHANLKFDIEVIKVISKDKNKNKKAPTPNAKIDNSVERPKDPKVPILNDPLKIKIPK